jgi:hypothetical protein
MKRFLFTAIAVIAFSGVSMAETKESKSEVKVEKQLLHATPCQDRAIDIYEYVMNEYNNGGDDIDLLNALLSNCQ